MSQTKEEGWSAEERAVRRQFQPWILKLIPLAIAFMGIFPYLVLTGRLDLCPAVKSSELSDFSSKLQFTLRFLSLGVLWMVFSMWYVISKRFPSPAVNPLSGHEHLTEAARNIMTNSLEQLLMSAFTQLSLLPYLNGEETRRAIPMLNILFLVGRITFWAGYPVYRSFGFWVTMWPTQIAMWYSIISLIEFLTGWNSRWITWGLPLLFYGGWYIQLRRHRNKHFGRSEANGTGNAKRE